MLVQDPSLSKDSTIYNYTLVKRIQHSSYKIALYFALLLALLVTDLLKGEWAAFVLSYPLILILHTTLVKVIFYFIGGIALKNWSFQFGVFWNGILPSGFSSLRLVRKIQFHVMWVGLMLMSGFYPWLPKDLLVHLVIIHLWFMLPRLWMLLSLRPYHKNELIKITPKDTSCYLQ